MNWYQNATTVQTYIQYSEGVYCPQLVKTIYEHIPVYSCILELGAGSGNEADILCISYRIHISDVSSHFLKHLRKRFYYLPVHYLDCRNMLNSVHYDAIYSNKVLHYLNDAQLRYSIKQQMRVLHSHGLLIHTFWEDKERFWKKKDKYSYIRSIEDLRALLQDLCSVYYIYRYSSSGEEEIDSFLVLLGKF